MSKAVWYPTEEIIQSSRLYQWMKSLGFDDYDAFFKASVEDIAWFWREAEKALGIVWAKPYEQTLDLSRGIAWPKWYVGGQLNVTYNALDKWLADPGMRQRLAVVWEGEDGEVRKYTYREMAIWVNQLAQGLLDQGIRTGDRIAIYMPMIPETVAIMLAAAKIGAIVTPAFSGYGADAVAKRLQGCTAKMLVTADGFYRRGKMIPMKEEADKACELAPSVEKVVVVRRLGREIPWRQGRDVEWAELESRRRQMECPPFASDHPFMIIYTSGTTGRPKGAVHVHSGFPIKAAFDAGFGMDLKPGEVLFWVTDMGWMMGPFLVFGALLNGATMVLYEGTPTYPGPDRIWKLVEAHGVTHLGISPTLVRSLMPFGEQLARQADLSSLRGIGTTGEPWNPEPWHWLFEKVCEKRIPIFNYSGGTEISGGILGNVLLRPIAPTGFNSPLPGMDVDVLDAQGQPIRGEVGELVIRQPWVGMTNGFWQEPQRYEETYWSRWPNIWVHGDWVYQDEEGFWYITGRSDDTLNVAGKRLGPAEMESVLVNHPFVQEAGTIGIPDEVKGEVPVCFVVLKPGKSPSPELAEELVALVGERLGKALQPKQIHFVDDLPKTRNAKIMRRAIRAAYLGQDAGDLSSLENPEAVRAIQALARQHG